MSAAYPGQRFALVTSSDLFSGERFDYSDIWQRKNLVLVLLPHAESAAGTKFVDQLTARMSELSGDDGRVGSVVLGLMPS